MTLPLQRILGALSSFGRMIGQGRESGGRALLGLFRRDHAGSNTQQVNFGGPPASVPAGRRVYAVGDVHGRADLLVRLIEDIRSDLSQGSFEGRPILIFLGDYVDRGFQSREVIDVLLSDLLSPFETYFLKGNHEAAMLQFLTDPSIGPRWAEFGSSKNDVKG